jgi:isopentenyl-diphosphate delta-isomerase
LAKITFPGLWTNTCCSHPLAELADEKEAAGGAGVKKAAQRRLQAELGVGPDQCPVNRITFLTRILYSARSGNSK